MHALQDLLRTVEGWPTILSAEQELALLAALQGIGEESLLNHFDDFSRLLSRLEESHAGSTIFEVSAANRPAFDAGAQWISRLARPPLAEKDQELLHCVAQTLRVRF